MAPAVRVFFYIEGFDENPIELAKNLGIEADDTSTKGLLSSRQVVSRFNSIEVNSQLPESASFDEHIRDIFSRIGNVKTLKARLPKNSCLGFSAHIYITKGDGVPRCPLNLSNLTLQTIAALNCSLSFGIMG